MNIIEIFKEAVIDQRNGEFTFPVLFYQLNRTLCISLNLNKKKPKIIAIAVKISRGFDLILDTKVMIVSYNGNDVKFPVIAHQQGYRVIETNVAQAKEDKHRRIYSPGLYVRRLLDLLTIFFLIKFTKKPLRFFGLVGRPLTPVSAAALTLVMGLGIDYGIFMQGGRRATVGEAAPAVLASAFTTLAAFGVLASARTRAMADLGLIILVGVLVAVFTAIVLVPLLSPRRAEKTVEP